MVISSEHRSLGFFLFSLLIVTWSFGAGAILENIQKKEKQKTAVRVVNDKTHDAFFGHFSSSP